MYKIGFFFLLLFVKVSFGQQSDFNHINFTKADNIAKLYKSKRLLELNKTTYNLTKNLSTDVEKLRAIYVWICNNIANDFSLYSLNERKRKKYVKDSLKLQNWNSKFKQKLFKKLLKKKKTICTGYAYLLKEMCNIAGIESKMVNGFGRTSSVDFTKLTMPNHTWNVVKLNNKWYLCDPTWSTGISFPEEGRFEFTYNDGYFLTDPKLFFQNHFPINSQYTLLKENPSFLEFTELPLLYPEAFNVLEKQITPNKMYHEVKKDATINFKYKLKKKIDKSKVKLVYFAGNNQRKLKAEININNDNILTVTNTFNKKGYYDIHLYIDNKIIVTHTISVSKS